MVFPAAAVLRMSAAGRVTGIPEKLISRAAFPGAVGLAIRTSSRGDGREGSDAAGCMRFIKRDRGEVDSGMRSRSVFAALTNMQVYPSGVMGTREP